MIFKDITILDENFEIKDREINYEGKFKETNSNNRNGRWTNR